MIAIALAALTAAGGGRKLLGDAGGMPAAAGSSMARSSSSRRSSKAGVGSKGGSSSSASRGVLRHAYSGSQHFANSVTIQQDQPPAPMLSRMLPHHLPLPDTSALVALQGDSSSSASSTSGSSSAACVPDWCLEVPQDVLDIGIAQVLQLLVYQPEGPGTRAEVFVGQGGAEMLEGGAKWVGEGGGKGQDGGVRGRDGGQEVAWRHAGGAPGRQGAEVVECVAVVEGKSFSQRGWEDPGSMQELYFSSSSSSGISQNGDKVAQGWYSYLTVVFGDYGLKQEDSLFPNVAVHLGMGLVAHNVRDVYDLVDLVAVPEEAAIKQHALHAVRKALDRGWHPHWVYARLLARWGQAALEEHGVDMPFVVGLGMGA